MTREVVLCTPGIDVGEPWETAGENSARMSPLRSRATQGVGRAQIALPGPVFLWTADRWALVLILGCILLGTPISSGLWALLLNETQVQDILCISSVFTCVFLILWMWVPANDNSPKLVEFD